MRFLGFLPFLLIGIIVGVLATRLFNRSTITAVANCVLGIFAATFGLFFRDLLNFESGVMSGLVAATLSSVIVVFAANIIGPLVLGFNDEKSD